MEKERIKLGLKLWSENLYYAELAEALYKERYCDYIELYVVPGTVKDRLSVWKALEIPFIIHAPHNAHGFNLADRAKKEYNKKLFNETKRFADELSAPYIIVHPGVLGDREEVKTQLAAIADKRMLIENKPYRTMDMAGICAGHSPHDVASYVKACSGGFCFDVAHAVAYAASMKKDYFEVIGEFLEIGPKVLHISGFDHRLEMDDHLHLKDGNADLAGVISLLKRSGAGFCTIETPKISKEDLDDFKEDVRFLKDLFGETK